LPLKLPWRVLAVQAPVPPIVSWRRYNGRTLIRLLMIGMRTPVPVLVVLASSSRRGLLGPPIRVKALAIDAGSS
jgi:hypothetical protein